MSEHPITRAQAIEALNALQSNYALDNHWTPNHIRKGARDDADIQSCEARFVVKGFKACQGKAYV